MSVKSFKSKKILVIYSGDFMQNLENVEKKCQTIFKDPICKIIQAHSNTQMTIIYISMGYRKSISCDKISQRLKFAKEDVFIAPYDSDLLNTYRRNCIKHYPQQILQEDLIKLRKQELSITQFIVKHPMQLIRLVNYKRSLQLLQQQKENQKKFTQIFDKRRGYWLYGKAGSGKTTFAIQKLFNKRPYYQKILSTMTFDGYKNEQNILYDQMNPKTAQKHLEALKNLINVIPAHFDVKYGHKTIYPKVVVVTTQYKWCQLSQDRELKDAMMARFFFFQLKMFQDQEKTIKTVKIKQINEP